MTKQFSFVEARKNLSKLVDEVAENNTRLVIQKRGKDKVVMISADDFLRSITSVDPFFAKVRAQAIVKNKNNFSDAEIEKEIKATRKVRSQKKMKNG